MKTPSSLWENPLSSSYLSCTHCKYAVSRNHSSELAQTLCKSSSVLCSEGWVDMCNGLLNDVVLAYCYAVCWCGKRECVVRTCWMVWLMMSSETAKAACVDVGEKVWWMKWAVRQGLCTRASVCVCVSVSEKKGGVRETKKKTVVWHFFPCLTVAPLMGQPRFESFPIWKEPPAWKFCESLYPLHLPVHSTTQTHTNTHHYHHKPTIYNFTERAFKMYSKKKNVKTRWCSGQNYKSESTHKRDKEPRQIRPGRKETEGNRWKCVCLDFRGSREWRGESGKSRQLCQPLTGLANLHSCLSHQVTLAGLEDPFACLHFNNDQKILFFFFLPL